ncbi:MAG: MFS transporter, partial [Nocardioidaceae bacterium]|nr:MFS transporter [Nocardioidaceae bacterium]
SVTPLQLEYFDMSFLYYATLVAVSYLVGAFGSVAAGIIDRFGRVNALVVGLVITGVLTGFVIPAVDDKLTFAILTACVGFVEGMALVATPALIRDYSPQVGRATAMGFWTMGPVLGSLIVSAVGTVALEDGKVDVADATKIIGATDWQHAYLICGIVGVIVAALCFLFLKELSPALRDQVMVSMKDKALIEARAAGIDVEAAAKNPWKQVIKLDIVISAVAIATFLLIYYTLTGTSVIYYQTAFKTEFTLGDANSLGNWQWAFLLAALVLIGWLSDKTGVRKPFMLVGAIGGMVMLIVFLNQAGSDPSYTKMAIIVSAMTFFVGIAYTPWMASFTEAVEAHNPALTANGLAVWGLIVRVIIFGTFLGIPQVVQSTNDLANYGDSVKHAAAKYSTPLEASQLPKGVLGFAQDPANAELVGFATKNADLLATYSTYTGEIETLAALPPKTTGNLLAGKPTAADLATVQGTATAVAAELTKSGPAVAASAQEANKIGIPVPAPKPVTATTILTNLSDTQASAEIIPAAQKLATISASDPKAVEAVKANALQLGVLSASSANKDFAFLQKHADEVLDAQSKTPDEWKKWYWICFGGMVFFLLTIPLMAGHWSPRKAKEEIAAHEALVAEELKKLKAGGGA